MTQLNIQVRRKQLERERAYLFPHIPLVEAILEKALEPGAVVKVSAGVLSIGLLRSSDPAMVRDLPLEPNFGFRAADQLTVKLQKERLARLEN